MCQDAKVAKEINTLHEGVQVPARECKTSVWQRRTMVDLSNPRTNIEHTALLASGVKAGGRCGRGSCLTCQCCTSCQCACKCNLLSHHEMYALFTCDGGLHVYVYLTLTPSSSFAGCCCAALQGGDETRNPIYSPHTLLSSLLLMQRKK